MLTSPVFPRARIAFLALATAAVALLDVGSADAVEAALLNCTQSEAEQGMDLLERLCDGPGMGSIRCSGGSILVEVHECFE